MRQNREHLDVAETIQNYADSIIYLFRRLPRYILGDDKISLESRRDALIAANVPPDMALRVACAEPMYHALNIIEVAKHGEIEIKSVAQVYFILLDRLKLIWFRQQINAYVGGDSYWVFLAKSSYKADLDTIQRHLTEKVFQHIQFRYGTSLSKWMLG